MKIDLRSDTVTRPTPEMLKAMTNAPVGDDVYGEDPSVNSLEEKAADMFGMEAALFCPSGTMTNQIAIKLHTKPQDEVICDYRSHIYQYEGGGIAATSMASVNLVHSERGILSTEDVRQHIRPDDVHFPRTSLVSLENTVNKGGGICYSPEDIRSISDLCHKEGLALHLDGARLFNAIISTGTSPKDYGQSFDTISICLSKGLGAPVGSLLLGNKVHIKEAKRIRKRLGGGMRQAGFLAAAGIYALQNHVERLAEDHERANQIAEFLKSNKQVQKVWPVETNIIIFELNEGLEVNEFVQKLASQGVLCHGLGGQSVRFVTHLDFTDKMTGKLREVLAGV